MTSTSRPVWKSTRALLAGFLAVVILSIGADQLLQILKVLPAGPMVDPRLMPSRSAIGSCSESSAVISLRDWRPKNRCSTPCSEAQSASS
jgi:hypothetical protein